LAFVIRLHHNAWFSECQTVPSSLPLLGYVTTVNAATLTCM